MPDSELTSLERLEKIKDKAHSLLELLKFNLNTFDWEYFPESDSTYLVNWITGEIWTPYKNRKWIQLWEV